MRPPHVQGLVLAVLLTATVGWAHAMPAPSPDAVPPEEYPIYDRVVQAKFLTSQTTLVMIARLTVVRLGEEEKPIGRDFFDAHQFFEGHLPPLMIADFVAKLRRHSALEQKFNFGVRYRLVTPQDEQGHEVSVRQPAPWLRPIDVSGPTIALEFSRVAFTPREDQALVYVGNHRPDGTGAGFLVWLQRKGREWEILDTEIIWTARGEES